MNSPKPPRDMKLRHVPVPELKNAWLRSVKPIPVRREENGWLCVAQAGMEISAESRELLRALVREEVGNIWDWCIARPPLPCLQDDGWHAVRRWVGEHFERVNAVPKMKYRNPA